MDSFLSVLGWLVQLAANVAIVAGVFIAVRQLSLLRKSSALQHEEDRRVREQDLREREYGTFDGLDNKYVEFMYHRALPENATLDIHSEPLDRHGPPSAEVEARERAYFAVLFSIFERAIVMFERRQVDELSKKQRQGWVDCIMSYCDRPSFRAEWAVIGHQFDEDFQAEMRSILARSDAQKNAQEHAEPKPPDA